MAKRVLVCGGRDYNDAKRVGIELLALHHQFGISHLIHGGASGADALAHAWAEAHNVFPVPCPADWKRHGKKAGPLRNAEMLRNFQPDIVLAFPGGRGTDDMIRKAMAAGVPVIQITLPPHSTVDDPTRPA